MTDNKKEIKEDAIIRILGDIYGNKSNLPYSNVELYGPDWFYQNRRDEYEKMKEDLIKNSKLYEGKKENI